MRVLLGLSLTVALALTLVAAEPPIPIDLLAGTDLSGWKVVAKDAKADVSKTWTLKNGVLICTGKPTSYVSTVAEYEKYTLKLKWRYAPTDLKRPNSGVLIHVQKDDAFWPHSYEAQLALGQAGDLWLQYDVKKQLPILTMDPNRKDAANKEGRHFFRIGKDDAIEKAVGEWNDYEITANGDALLLKVNGVKVNDATACSLKKGRIALQAEGAEIHFKEMTLTPLPR